MSANRYANHRLRRRCVLGGRSRIAARAARVSAARAAGIASARAAFASAGIASAGITASAAASAGITAVASVSARVIDRIRFVVVRVRRRAVRVVGLFGFGGLRVVRLLVGSVLSRSRTGIIARPNMVFGIVVRRVGRVARLGEVFQGLPGQCRIQEVGEGARAGDERGDRRGVEHSPSRSPIQMATESCGVMPQNQRSL